MQKGMGIFDIKDIDIADITDTPEMLGDDPTPSEEIVVNDDPTPKEEYPKANVRLSSESKDKALPEGITNIGMVTVKVPDKETQLKGFYVEEPGVFVAQFRQFKFIQKKGENVPSIKI